MGSNKITNLATPTADTDAATKGYVDAATPTLYITTTRAQGQSTGCSYPDAYCPTNWGIVTSWTYLTTFYKDTASYGICWRETLCSK